jgi:hypothetical protein
MVAPVAQGDLLKRLRGDGAPRPAVDPGLAGGLRDWLEDGLMAAAAALPADAAPVFVSKQALSGVLACEAAYVASRSASRPPTLEMARGSLVDALFRQWVTTGAIWDPMVDGLAALEVGGVGEDGGDTRLVAELCATDRLQLAEEVTRHATVIVDRWPHFNPGWLPRTQERLHVPLAGGRVVLAGVIDLALGRPAEERASVCIVEVKSGRRRVEHRGDIHFYALLETLRSGAPPFRVATYYTSTGELDVEPVTEAVLAACVERVLEATGRLCRLAAGGTPRPTPNGLCAWCQLLPDCPPGQDRAGAVVPLERSPADDDLLPSMVGGGRLCEATK